MIAKCINNSHYEDFLRTNKYYKILEGNKNSTFISVKGEKNQIVECYTVRFVDFRRNNFEERIQ